MVQSFTCVAQMLFFMFKFINCVNAVECDVLLFRQTAGTYLSKDEWLSVGTKDDDNYSILNQLEDYRNTDGDFVFTILWPQKTGPNRNVWKQSSNPLGTTEAVYGYQAIEENFNAGLWGGLATSNGANTLLDGSVGYVQWWYAIGTTVPYGGGIPGPEQPGKPGLKVSQTELWIHVENCAATTTTEAAATTTTAESCVDGVPGADWCLSATVCDFFDQENYCNEFPAYMNVCCQNTCGTCDVSCDANIKYYVDDGCTNEGDEKNAYYSSQCDSIAGVRCCNSDGTTCYTPGTCSDAVADMWTYAEAEALCTTTYGSSWRLCTKMELGSDICCGTGGQCDNYYVWSSTPETAPVAVPGRRNLNQANAVSKDGTAVQKEIKPTSRLLNKK